MLTSDANGLATWETAPADGSVTSAKLAADAVTSVKIAAGAVTTVKLADDSVTRSKLAADSCTDGQILKLNASGEWVCAVEGGGGVPSTAVMFFNNTVCPSGWTAISAAQGRYLVGLPTSGTLAGTTGTALSNQENRPVGQHNHGVSDPGHAHSYEDIGVTGPGFGGTDGNKVPLNKGTRFHDGLGGLGRGRLGAGGRDAGDSLHLGDGGEPGARCPRQRRQQRGGGA